MWEIQKFLYTLIHNSFILILDSLSLVCADNMLRSIWCVKQYKGFTTCRWAKCWVKNLFPASGILCICSHWLYLLGEFNWVCFCKCYPLVCFADAILIGGIARVHLDTTLRPHVLFYTNLFVTSTLLSSEDIHSSLYLTSILILEGGNATGRVL